MQAIVLAAGKGTRMRSQKSKVLHELFGKPILEYVLDNLDNVGIRKPIVVVGADGDRVRSFINKRGQCVTQEKQLGTGHAVLVAKDLTKSTGDLLVWPGDMPLIELKTLKQFIRSHQRSKNAVSILTAKIKQPQGYGRIIRKSGAVMAIREELDATLQEREINEVNTGVYLFRAKKLFQALSKIKPKNKKNEFYLTDAISILVEAKQKVSAYLIASEEECLGVNNRVDLSAAIRSLRDRINRFHQERGVTIVDAEQTFIAPDVRIGKDTVVYPFTYIERNVKIGEACQIGPFAKIRSGCELGEESVVGSFVEINRSKLAAKVTAKHLTYLGDAVIAEGANIGAGVITANYDGIHKHKTRIGKNALIGSNTVLIAPVTIGSKSKTGAGAVIKSGTVIKEGELAVGVPARVVTQKNKKQNMKGKKHVGT